MSKVYVSTVIPAPRDKVWAKIRDFNTLPEWHPAIATSELEGGDGVGCVRHFTLQDGAELREQLIALSDFECSYMYSMLESPMPIANYECTLKLSEITSNGQTFGEWWAYFDVTDPAAVDDTLATVQGVFQSGFDNLLKIFG